MLTFDLNGHFGTQPGDILTQKGMGGIFHSTSVQRWVESYEFGKEYQSQLKERKWPMLGTLECSECGVSTVWEADYENDRLTLGKSVCLCVGGVKPYSVRLGIPSGKIVFANDLRDLVRCEEPSTSVNSKRGQKLTTENYAKAGMVQVFVGNTCPIVSRLPDGRLTVSTRSKGYGKKLGSICTDLWWYSAMDHDLFVERCAREGIDPSHFDSFIVEVEPGTYEFTDELPADRDARGGVFYSYISRVEAPAPEIAELSFKSVDKLSESHIFQTVARYCSRGFIGGGHAPGVLSYVLFVGGNGIQWVNGFPISAHGAQDAPFGKLSDFVRGKDPAMDTVVDSVIEEMPVFSVPVRDIYPTGLDWPSVLGRAPLNIDHHWLVAGMMMTAAAVKDPEATKGRFVKAEEDQSKQRETMWATFHYLLKIVYARKIPAEKVAELAQALLLFDKLAELNKAKGNFRDSWVELD